MKIISSENVISNHFKFVLLMLLMCVLAFARIMFSLDIPVAIFIVISAFISICSNREENVTLMCSLIPLSACFQYRWALGIAVLIYALKIRKLRVSYFLPLLLMMLWEWFHAGRSGMDVYFFLKEFSELFALTVILADKSIDYSDGFPIRFFSYMAVLGNVFNYIALMKLYNFSISSLKRFGVNYEDVESFKGLFNANTISYICVIAISGLLLLRFYQKNKKTDTVIILLLIGFIFLSQSKSALICLFIVFISHFLLAFHRFSIKAVANFFGSVTACLLCIYFFMNNVINSIIERFLVEDISTGRISITIFYYEHLVSKASNWLYGVGLFRYTKQIKNIYGDLGWLYPGTVRVINSELVYFPVHNNVQEILVVWGVVGVFLCVYLFYVMFKHSKRRIPKANSVTFFVLLIYGLQGQFLSNGVVLLTLLFSLVCLEYTPQISEHEGFT